jgi:hypothetical protein
MAIVPRYGDTKIALAPLPGVRRTQAQTALSEGAGVDEAIAQKDETAGSAIGGPIERTGLAALADVAEEERTKADQTALLKAQNQLSDWKNQTLYDPQTGAFTKKGEAALPLPEDVHDSFTKATDAIGAGLTTPKQQQAWARVKAQEWESVDLQVRRHVFGEMQTYQAGEFKSFLANTTDEAVRNASDPKLVGINLGKAVSAIKTMAPALGMGPEAVDAQVRGLSSDVHVQVISQLLATDQTQQAKDYFQQVKGAISAERLDDVEKAIAIGTHRNDAQTLSDAIIAEGGSVTEQLAKARARSEGAVRDEAVTYIKQRRDEVDKQQRDDTEALVAKSFATLDQTHDLRNIPPADLVKLGSHVETLRHYQEFLTKGEAVPTNWAVYGARMLKAATDPQAFAQEDPMRFRADLSDTELKQQIEIRSAILKSGNADKELTDYRQHNELIDNSLTQYGVDVKKADKDPTSGPGQAKAELHRMVNQAVAIQEQQTGKKATTEDVQSTVDRILGTSVNVPGSWWTRFTTSDFSVSQTPTPVLGLTIHDVPVAQQDVIRRQLQAAGAAATDVTILDAYKTLLVRKKAIR